MRLFNNRRSVLQDRISSLFVCLHSLQSGCYVFRLLPRGEYTGSDRIRITFIEGVPYIHLILFYFLHKHKCKSGKVRVHYSKTTNCTVITPTSEASFFRFFSWWFPMFDPRTVHGLIPGRYTVHGTKTENTHRKYAYVRKHVRVEITVGIERCIFVMYTNSVSAQQQPRYRGSCRGICSLTASH